jgi:hypothetical protein
VRHLVALLAWLALSGGASGASPGLLVAVGDASPLGLPFSRFSDVALDDRGRVAFIGTSTAIFRRTGGAIARVIGAGDGLAGGVLAGVGAPALGGGACLGFRAVFVNGGPAVFRRCDTHFEQIAAVGDPAPRGGAFVGFGTEVGVGPGGQVAFTALLDDASTGLFVAALAGGVSEVARTGSAAAAGGRLTAIRLAGVSASGRVGFCGLVSAGPAGLFVWDGVQVRPLAVVNDASPGGGQFRSFGGATVNDADTWTFRATVSGGGSAAFVPLDGVFRAQAAGPVPVFSTVVLEGDPSPLGGTFRQIPTSLMPSINASGTIAFRATLQQASASAAVFTAAPDGRLTPVVSIGQRIVPDTGEPEGAALRRLGEAVLGSDGSLLVRATLVGGTPGLFVARDGEVKALARLGEATDLGSGFRFADGSVRGAAETGLFLGLQDGVYVAGAPGLVEAVAVLGDPTPLGGTYAGFEPPAGGPDGRLVFGASIHGGKTSDALFAVGRRGPVAIVRVDSRVPGGGRIVDLFPDTLDPITRVSIAPGSVAFHAALGDTRSNAGVFLRLAAGIRSVVRAGDRAPGGGEYLVFGTPAAMSRRRAAFVAQVRGEGTALFVAASKRSARAVAVAGKSTQTRLAGVFGTFDPPVASDDLVAFRSTLARPGVEGVFLAGGQTLVALAGTGDEGAGGGRLRSFGAPVFAGGAVVFHIEVGGGATGSGLYRVTAAAALANEDVTPEVVPVVLAGQASPLDGRFVAFGLPSGNVRSAIAYTADLVGARAAGGVFLQAGADGSVP